MTDTNTTPAQEKFRILLIGDNCTDVYQYGTVDRISPEAPIPVFVPGRAEEKPGMAGNVLLNLQALGCSVDFLCGHASKKTRLIDSRSRQQIVRVDEDVKSTAIKIDSELPNIYDAIVISDYNKGVVSYDLIEDLINRSNVPVFIDTKKTDLGRMQGAWVKINELEFSKITSECSGMIVTLGAEGAVVPHHDIKLPASRVEVADVCGAGDTFLSALTYKYCRTRNIEQSVKFAIKASAITVQHLGNYAPTLEEIECVS